MITITEQSFDPAEELSKFTQSSADAGGIVNFTGLVRPNASRGKVQGLFLQAYSPMTERGIEDVTNTAKLKWPLAAVLIIHRIGHIAPGEAIVFVATAAKHRRDAFEAADYLMDYLKTEAIFWKKETYADGSNWIEPRQQDHKDAKRWSDNEETSHGRT